uniref:ATPase ASNA1 homolog n=1 Tax=Syphacia muris TaxID=451379 RepID=A0A0N5AT87_9BILA
MAEEYEPSLRNVVEQRSLRWIFVGGKGGTVNCSLAVQLTKVRRNVLLISTDPAHNISDAFSQKFTKTPTVVNGFENLFAMVFFSGLPNSCNYLFLVGGFTMMFLSMPGIDEAMSFVQIFRLIGSMDFDVVVFDTAPTGHTLRLLQFPALLENTLEKILSVQNSLSPGLIGNTGVSADQAMDKLKDAFQVTKEVNIQFKNPDYTTFICVCIAEFLSLYETERLIQELTKQHIDVHNIIVNQLLFPEEEGGVVKCKKCRARCNMQCKYLEQIAMLYDDFNITKLPQLDDEVRGVEEIKQFSQYLVQPYCPGDSPK